MHTININMVRGHSYKKFLRENLSYESFLTQKFPDLQYFQIYGTSIFLQRRPYRLYSNITQAKKKITLSHDFLVKVISCYIKIHYKNSQNANFLH